MSIIFLLNKCMIVHVHKITSLLISFVYPLILNIRFNHFVLARSNDEDGHHAHIGIYMVKNDKKPSKTPVILKHGIEHLGLKLCKSYFNDLGLFTFGY